MRTRVKDKKEYNRKRRHRHIRHTVVGTEDRPRVCVFRSNYHIYAQIIDDSKGLTLASSSSLKLGEVKPAEEPAGEGKKGKKKKTAPASARILRAKEVGRLLAEAAKEKGINKVRFDRGGYLYHGCVAALADSLRENGLEF